eukprot:3792937-Rhodomonas_salina.2
MRNVRKTPFLTSSVRFVPRRSRNAIDWGTCAAGYAVVADALPLVLGESKESGGRHTLDQCQTGLDQCQSLCKFLHVPCRLSPLQ